MTFTFTDSEFHISGAIIGPEAGEWTLHCEGEDETFILEEVSPPVSAELFAILARWVSSDPQGFVRTAWESAREWDSGYLAQADDEYDRRKNEAWMRDLANEVG